MAEGPGYDVQLKRRRDGSTDYGKRLELLKSGDVRAVVRISNNHARVQLVAYSDEGDATLVSASSDHLDRFGWDGHTGNLPAAYLTGVLAGYRAKAEGVEQAVADLGAMERERGSRHYAAVKGVQDAGVNIPADDTMFPAEDRLAGQHLDDGAAETVEDVKKTIASEYGGDDG